MQHLQISLHPVVLLAYFWPFRPFQTQLLAQSPVVSFDMYGMCVDVHKQSRRLLNVTNVSHGFTWMWTLTSISYPHYILWYEGAKTISVCVNACWDTVKWDLDIFLAPVCTYSTYPSKAFSPSEAFSIAKMSWSLEWWNSSRVQGA